MKMEGIDKQILLEAVDRAFVQARTFNVFSERPVDDDTLHRLYETLKWGPTSMNSQPGRYLFLRSTAAKKRLAPALAPGNRQKALNAPVTVIVAQDLEFYDQLPTQFPAVDARPVFSGNAPLSESTAFRNSSLQGAYLIVAARLLGLDAGPMSGFDAAKVDAEFFPHGQWRANFLVNLGYGDPAGNYPRGPRLPFDAVAKIL